MEEKDTTYSSIWLFRKNRTLWKGTKDPIANMPTFRDVRGRNYSEFNPTVAENIINFWSDKGDTILDPFAGRTRALISSLKKRKYIGFEISKDVYNKTKQVIYPLCKNPKPIIYNEDSFNIDKKKIKPIDFIFSCPPYWDIEKYESCDGQLSDIKDYNQFLDRYKEILNKSIKLLKQNKYCALVVGDFRRKGIYYNFHMDTINIMKELGLKLHDLIIIQSVSFDIANKRFGGIKKYKMTSKIHEYLLIFKKVIAI